MNLPNSVSSSDMFPVIVSMIFLVFLLILIGLFYFYFMMDNEIRRRMIEKRIRKKLSKAIGPEAKWASIQSLSKRVDDAGISQNRIVIKCLNTLELMEKQRFGRSEYFN